VLVRLHDEMRHALLDGIDDDVRERAEVVALARVDGRSELEPHV
jgi:hypothetical protein